MNHPEVIAEIAAARAAFESDRTRPAEWRLGQLRAVETMLGEREQEFAAALKNDLGKAQIEAWVTELSFVINAARFAQKRLKRWMRDERVPTPLPLRPGRAWIRSEPLGTVLIIAPWNYPLQLCLAPLVSTISAGNTAVIKPSELAPATAQALAEWLPHYLDADAFRVIQGGVETSTALLEQPFDHIVFTGGERVARIVMTAAAKHLTPVTLELGGKSPCLVLPDANLDVTARRIAWGKFTNAGQTCIAPDYLLCDGATREALLPRLRRAIEDMYGPDAAESADYGRIVSDSHFDRIEGLIGDCDIAIGGERRRETRFIAPTVLTGVSPDDPVMREEIFGPLLPVVVVEDFEAALEFVKQRPKPLAAYLFSGSAEAARAWEEEVSAGSVSINDVLVFLAVEELPFSGVGPSGHGTYKGEFGFRRLSHRKAVLKRGWWPDFPLRYAPYSGRKSKWLRKLF